MTTGASQRRPAADRISEGVAVTIVYLCAQGLMLLNKGIYWDDWVWFRQPWAVLTDVSRQLGSLWPGWAFAVSYQSEATIWVTRIAVAACYLLAALWFLGIVRHFGVDRRTRLLMAMCFAVFPVNGARVPIATAAYGISLALFVGGFRLVVASMERPSVWLRVGAAFALLLSLRTPSFGLMLPMVYLYVLWYEDALREPRRWLAIAASRAELLAVPATYVVLRAFVLVPSGVYGDYNTITGGSALQGLAGLPAGVYHSLASPALLGATRLIGAGGLAAAAVVFTAAYFGRGTEGSDAMSRRAGAWWLLAGLALVVVAILPYLLVGKMPALTDFDSRHQLLVPFGVAFAFGGGLRLLFGPSERNTLAMLVVASLLLGGFVAVDVSNNLSYLRERYKHIAMMEAMRLQPAFRSATTFTFLDRTRDLNANRRTSVREYEYAGMMTEVFGDQTRFGADADEYARTGMAGFRERFTSLYKMGAYVERPVQYRAEVVPGTVALGDTGTVLWLLYMDVMHPSALPTAAAGAVVVRPAATNAGQ